MKDAYRVCFSIDITSPFPANRFPIKLNWSALSCEWTAKRLTESRMQTRLKCRILKGSWWVFIVSVVRFAEIVFDIPLYCCINIPTNSLFSYQFAHHQTNTKWQLLFVVENGKCTRTVEILQCKTLWLSKLHKSMCCNTGFN